MIAPDSLTPSYIHRQKPNKAVVPLVLPDCSHSVSARRRSEGAHPVMLRPIAAAKKKNDPHRCPQDRYRKLIHYPIFLYNLFAF
jgi:hypothetical protein